MNAKARLVETHEWLARAVNSACQRIAPVWPLDKSIAVNPWWTQRAEPIPTVAAKLKTLGNINMLMDKSYYLSQWHTQITSAHLASAAATLNIKATETALLDYLKVDDSTRPWMHLGDLLDQQECHLHKVPWRDEVIQQISQFTALYFQYPERMQHNHDVENGFYKMWREVASRDKGIEILMDQSGLHAQFLQLPNTINDVFAAAQLHMGQNISEAAFTQYCHSLLLDINGWASWMANCAWQDAFINQENNLLQQLLAVRMAWDIVLWRHADQQSPEKFAVIREAFITQISTVQAAQAAAEDDQRLGWVWQTALELSYQEQLHTTLLAQSDTDSQHTQETIPELHAFFCIDVRSEPIRRALEAQSPTIKTSGFAGFFGLPIEYAIADSSFVRPQLPGLLKASIRAVQTKTAGASKVSLFKRMAAKQIADSPPSTFGVIEATGLLKSFKLLKNSLFPAKTRPGVSALNTTQPFTLLADNKPIEHSQAAEILAGVLNAMGLTTRFAKRILLVGHASCTANNPHAARLDCGACGGQSGEVNVKVLAQLLNDANIRCALQSHHIHIPDTTLFSPCLHNTTTDELELFEEQSNLPGELWKDWLSAATQTAQKQRAHSVGINEQSSATQIAKAFGQQSNDWAQLRPEWGLANNAAFIVAPRSLTQNINLQGRAFLHDYDWHKDNDFSVLELIITAPMVVTNWINMQYYASVTDNPKYGSGNKLLHNVVGGNMGVFEGNGGDLRIGLPLQSVNDGQQWRHQPLRLSVYLQAPKHAITEIVRRHQPIEDLINNQWLHLFQLDDNGQSISKLQATGWVSTHNSPAINNNETAPE